jgi:AcrR family transcriptional regulator
MASGETKPIGRPRSPGRPRLYQPDDERDRILAGALEVLRRSDGGEVTVADILHEAGLSTRAFYRHFETKEDVIRSLYERDAESFGAHLRRRVEITPDPDQALAIWVYEMLGLAYDRRRAERVTALSSPAVLRVVAGTRAEQLGTDLLVEPLRSVLADGLATGWFPDARPDRDSQTIWAITTEAVSWARSGRLKLSRKEAAGHVLRFSRAALKGFRETA